jgi:preprotein translocase subunit Sss1
MGVAVSLIIAAVGLVLALAVHPASEGAIDVNTVGWILFLVGLIGFVIDLLLWSSWGPGYLRNSTRAARSRAT